MIKDDYKGILEQQLTYLLEAQKKSPDPTRYTDKITEILKMLTYGDYE